MNWKLLLEQGLEHRTPQALKTSQLMSYKDFISMSLGWLALFSNRGLTNLCNPKFYYIVSLLSLF